MPEGMKRSHLIFADSHHFFGIGLWIFRIIRHTVTDGKKQKSAAEKIATSESLNLE